MSFSNEKIVIVVTGASAGLGRAVAHAFAKHGASLALIARNPEALEAAKEECERLGGSALGLPLDVADSEAVEAAVARVEAELGPIDVWVNGQQSQSRLPCRLISAAVLISPTKP
jgi:NAD(P)-dependent dehydrogenase (short-subunit alcohol dehydrogenase family)